MRDNLMSHQGFIVDACAHHDNNARYEIEGKEILHTILLNLVIFRNCIQFYYNYYGLDWSRDHAYR